MTETLETKTCSALVSEPPHYFRRHVCGKKATTTVGTHDVCGVHARVARTWEAEGRLDSMVEHWWGRGER